MYYYQLGSGSYDEYNNITLTHSEKFSDKKFSKLVKKATDTLLKKEKKKKAKRHLNANEITVDITIKKLAKYLCKKKGFKTFKIKSGVYFKPLFIENFDQAKSYGKEVMESN